MLQPWKNRSSLLKEGRMRIYGTENVDTLTREIGNRLRGIRVKAALTQKELSERSGVPKAMITRLENGIPIRMDSLMELMRALGCLGNLQVLLPETELTASEMLQGKTSRVRVRHPKTETATGRDWKWGDEA